jgi:hypothetical protein
VSIDKEMKNIEITFEPGAFDNFEGSQEELDELIAEIRRMAESGELFEQSREIDFDNPSDEDLEAIEQLNAMSNNFQKRTLQ